VAVGALLGAIVEVLDDDGLATGVPALQEHDHLVGLEELHHRAAIRDRDACDVRAPQRHREMAKEEGRCLASHIMKPLRLTPNPNSSPNLPHAAGVSVAAPKTDPISALSTLAYFNS
jgi:hypothetical protein